MYFGYSKREVEFFKDRDKLLGAAVNRNGHIYLPADDYLFFSVIHYFIGQQISIHAQTTIWQRLFCETGVINAVVIYSLKLNELQKLSMTFKKAEYIKDFAEEVRKKYGMSFARFHMVKHVHTSR